MNYRRTYNIDLVRAVALNPRVWPYLIDDYPVAKERWVPVLSEANWYVSVIHEHKVLGVVAFMQQTHVIWEIHPLIHPDVYWAGNAREAVRGAIDWIWENNSMCHRIVGYVPVFPHKTKLLFPDALGMEQYGLNPKSHMKDGKLWDVAEFGISRPLAKV